MPPTGQKVSIPALPQKWGIWFAVEGDLRFASHHDMMRFFAHAAARAKLPVKYSQGFNPRPILSLACPRPVGVAGNSELLVVCLDAEDEDIDGQTLQSRLAMCVPPGLRLLRAEKLTGKDAPQPRKMDYEWPVNAGLEPEIRLRLSELAEMESWPTERRTPGDRRKKTSKARACRFDLKPLLSDIGLEDGVLRWSHVRHGDKWARPGEFLRLLGADERADLAFVTRINVEYENTCLAEASRPAHVSDVGIQSKTNAPDGALTTQI